MDENTVVVARIRLTLADGLEETWMVPMRLADDALSYTAAVYPPAGADVLGVEPLQRAADTEREIVIPRASVAAPAPGQRSATRR